MPLAHALQLALLAAAASALSLQVQDNTELPTDPTTTTDDKTVTDVTTSVFSYTKTTVWKRDYNVYEQKELGYPTIGIDAYLHALEARILALEGWSRTDHETLFNHETRITVLEAGQNAIDIDITVIQQQIKQIIIDIDIINGNLKDLEPRVAAAEAAILDLRARRVIEDQFVLNENRIDLPLMDSSDTFVADSEPTVHTWAVAAGEYLDVAASFDIGNDSIEGVGARAQLWAEPTGTGSHTVVAESRTESSTVMGRTAELSMLYRARVAEATTFTLRLGSIVENNEQYILKDGARVGVRTYGLNHAKALNPSTFPFKKDQTQDIEDDNKPSQESGNEGFFNPDE